MNNAASTSVTGLVLVAVIVAAASALVARSVPRRRDLGTTADRTTFATLHTAAPVSYTHLTLPTSDLV